MVIFTPFYLEDMLKQVNSHKVKFADDGTVWRTDTDIKTLETQLQEDLNSISEWTSKWRMKLNAGKTEYCMFSKDPDNTPDIHLELNGLRLTRVKQSKVLGVVLDEKLTFNQHVQYTETKVLRALGLLSCVAKSEKVSPQNMIKLYQSLIVPYLEYASSVWQTSTSVQILEKVQRKGLMICLGAMGTSSCESLEIQSGVPPLDLRRTELAIRECTKLMAKGLNHPLKQYLDKCREEEKVNDISSTPVGKMLMQVYEMETLTETNTRCIEPELTYLEFLQPSRRRHTYWNNLGSSKNRTAEQQIQARKAINQQLHDINPDAAIAFTDGSCRGNPGPCGWENKLHIKAVQEVKSIWKASEKGGTTIKLDWSPGHAAIAGNEIADRLAKEAALQAEEMKGESQEPITQGM
ncbi:uncharacterized protein LOC128554947 [Mercenaria mercenaria]|uniref:uncharacterized protein LOC128554947 n=1 Tax=Mercenaria mercenaria TaxID=6596 RepID=UPI00234FB387|nr:uncharacterized protein LOC128554947 [Mercenaria mercenaria]